MLYCLKTLWVTLHLFLQKQLNTNPCEQANIFARSRTLDFLADSIAEWKTIDIILPFMNNPKKKCPRNIEI
jgi:hypothetical protein